MGGIDIRCWVIIVVVEVLGKYMTYWHLNLDPSEIHAWILREQYMDN